MPIDTAMAFRSALRGLKVLHDKSFLHRDLKPANIGFFDKKWQSVILDVGSCRHVPKGEFLESTPGSIGTIGYLAPETEMGKYDHSVDIWAMGIILFELTYGYHPWKLAINPWRAGKENEKLRPGFERSYQEAVDLMGQDYRLARASRAVGYLHREYPQNVSQSIDGVFR